MEKGLNKGMEGIIRFNIGLVSWLFSHSVCFSVPVHQSTVHPVRLATNQTLFPLQMLLTGGEGEIGVRKHLGNTGKSSLSASIIPSPRAVFKF